MTLRIASFGVRGFVGTSLTPKVAMDFAGAFAAHLNGGRVLLGRDTRGSTRMLHSAVASSLLGAGCEVLNFGICPTPMLQFSVQPYQ
ncbi:MAG: phosphoglucosamine mutase, partial [Kiritimatiellaeota bacterium]|nr:phosphoglucosamine mutase [Kiritimatiellota bacterium]